MVKQMVKTTWNALETSPLFDYLVAKRISRFKKNYSSNRS